MINKLSEKDQLIKSLREKQEEDKNNKTKPYQKRLDLIKK